MGEHDDMTNEQVHALVQQRLAQGKPVGRLINTLQSRGQSTSGYQSRRTTRDIAAHVRWKSYQGQSAPEETQELNRRTRGTAGTTTSASDEHSHLSNAQIHALIQQRLAEGKRVGRLINTLRSRGEGTSQYQSQRTTSDIEAHVRWTSAYGIAAPEETQELQRRSRTKARKKPWWKFW